MGIKIYCDGASLSDFEKFSDDERISGFTTNPSILRKAGITDYKTFAKTVLSLVKGKPVSFEVLSDSFIEMERQAHEIQSWGDNVYVKVPITNTKGLSSAVLINLLRGINLNVTAVMTVQQIMEVMPILRKTDILSVFVGRINDTGENVPDFRGIDSLHPQILWASAREIYTLKVAEHNGYDIITLTPDLISKLELDGKDLTEYSRETVQMFYNDGKGLIL